MSEKLNVQLVLSWLSRGKRFSTKMLRKVCPKIRWSPFLKQLSQSCHKTHFQTTPFNQIQEKNQIQVKKNKNLKTFLSPSQYKIAEFQIRLLRTKNLSPKVSWHQINQLEWVFITTQLMIINDFIIEEEDPPHHNGAPISKGSRRANFDIVSNGVLTVGWS